MNITYILIGITALISFYAFNNSNVMAQLIMNPYVTYRRNQYYRFVTSGLIHKDHMHLIFNMISLYFFGPIIEQVFTAVFGTVGTIYYVLLYILAIVVSDIPTYLKHRNDPGYNSLGASGGISAIIFAFILFLPTQNICLYFALCMPGFILGTLYVIYSYYQGKRGGDNINHDAHLYGAVFGVIFCIILYPASVSLFVQQISDWNLMDYFK
jgi:membrane associated rhomboid family serine protease